MSGMPNDGAEEHPAEPQVPPTSAGGSELLAVLRLQGDRFDAEGLPAESAREVAFYRDVLLEMVRSAWLDSNPDWGRLPNHFERNFDLRFVGIQEGSALMELALVRRSQQDDDEWTELHGAALVGRDALTEAVQTLGRAGALPSNFPTRAVTPLKRLGTTLGEDELMEVGSPVPAERRAALDRATLQILRDIDELLPPAPVDAELLGVLTEFDGLQGSFRIRTDAGVHDCRLAAGDEELAREVHRLVAFDGVTAPDVRIVGETLSPEARKLTLFNVDSLQIVRSVAEKVVVQRIRQIEQLEPGWLGPGSRVPEHAVTERVLQLAADIAGTAIPVAVVPDADGAVVLEWRRGDVEFTASFTDEGVMHLMADNTETDAIREHTGDYDDVLVRQFLRTGDLPR